MEDFLERFLDWRGIETPCKRCSGAGSYGYGNTATWHYDIGGSMITWGICDLCWGSGDHTRPWPNLKVLEDELGALRKFKNKVEKRESKEADPTSNI
jgi:hypothetical protein